MIFSRFNKTQFWIRLAPIKFQFNIFDILVIVFIIIYGLIGMRNFDIRMANLHQDDGPILFAYAFKDPLLFKGDYQVGAPIELRTKFKIASTTMNLIPALLWRYLDVDPYGSTWVMTFIQVTFLGASVYILTFTIARQRSVAITAAIFVYASGLWGWTPANYGSASSRLFSPYPAHLALAPALLAFASLLRGRQKTTLLLLIVTGLIHPSLALYACAIVGLYWLWTGVETGFAAVWPGMVGLAVAGLIIIAPTLWVQLTLPGESLPQAEIIAGMRHNQHIWPWGFEGRWPISLYTTLKWLLLAGLSWRWHIKFSRQVKYLWLAALAGAILLSLSHILGALWQMPVLLNLIGLRSWIWVAFLSLPMVVYYWLAHIRSGNWIGAVLSMLCLALPLYAREYGLFWPLIIGLLLVDLSQGYLGAWKPQIPKKGRYGLQMIALLILILWGSVFIAMPFNLPNNFSLLRETLSELAWGVKGTLPTLSGRIILLVFVGTGGGIAWLANRFTNPQGGTEFQSYYLLPGPVLMAFLVLFYGSYSLWGQWQVQKAQRASAVVDSLSVQQWARKNTPPSSLFVAPVDGWRTISLRRQLNPFTLESYAYIAPRQTQEHRARLLAFYGISMDEGQQLRGRQILNIEQERFLNFTDTDFLRYHLEFGATHLVLPKKMQRRAFHLPLVYENPSFLVFSLDPQQYELTRRRQQEEDSTVIKKVLEDALFWIAVKAQDGQVYVITNTGLKFTVEETFLAEGPNKSTQALKMDQVDKLSQLAPKINLTRGSLSIWAQLTNTGMDNVPLIRVNDNDLYILHRKTNGKFVVYYHDVSLGTSSIPITDDKWHHYTFTWQDDQQVFYIDGVQALTAKVTASTLETGNLTLGRTKNTQWEGAVTELIIFNSVLTPEETAALYRMGGNAIE